MFVCVDEWLNMHAEVETAFGFWCLASTWEKHKKYKKKKNTKKNIHHKWQMAILVALQCCSPLAYIKTSFSSV